MENSEKEISHNDKIFATLTHNGTRLAYIDSRNFNSVADVVRYVYATSKRWIGVAILSIRNYNQGWRIDLPLTFKAINRVTPSLSHSGRQYVIPFV